jgi:hypothetical protein
MRQRERPFRPGVNNVRLRNFQRSLGGEKSQREKSAYLHLDELMPAATSREHAQLGALRLAGADFIE